MLNAELVTLMKQVNSEEFQPLADSGADFRRVFADSGCENQNIEPAQGRHVGADVFSDPVAESADGAGALHIPLCRAGENLPHVIFAGDSLQSAFPVQHLVHAFHIQGIGPHQMQKGARIHISRPCSHDQAFERGHAHRGVDTAAMIDRTDGGAASQVAGDDFQLAHGAFQPGGRPEGNVLMVGAVESVTTDMFLFTELMGKGVGISVTGHGLVEGGVKNGHLRNGRQKSPHELNARQVVRVMQRRKVAGRTDRLDDVFVDQDSIREGRAAVNNPVADGIEITQFADGLASRIGHRAQHDVKGVFHRHDVFLIIFSVCSGGIDFMDGVTGTDFFNLSFQERKSLDGVKEGIFHRRAAAVQDQDFHRFRSGGEIQVIGILIFLMGDP